MKTLKNLSRVSKIKTPLQQRLFPFTGVELDDHGLNVTTKIIGVNRYFEKGIQLDGQRRTAPPLILKPLKSSGRWDGTVDEITSTETPAAAR